jgi:solute carrier family 25 phosphate transporter 23/24/25/41
MQPPSSSSTDTETQPSPDTARSSSHHDTFDAVYAGAQERPPLPHLRSDPPPPRAEPPSLADFRALEGRTQRRAQLRELWHQLPTLIRDAQRAEPGSARGEPLDSADARRLRQAYVRELLGTCTPAGAADNIGWGEFKDYALRKEEGASRVTDMCVARRSGVAELWHIFHDELDLDGNGRLDASELTLALRKAGVFGFNHFCATRVLSGAGCRHRTHADYTVRFYDVPGRIAALARDQLPRVS